MATLLRAWAAAAVASAAALAAASPDSRAWIADSAAFSKQNSHREGHNHSDNAALHQLPDKGCLTDDQHAT
jgi:hypothetical protein